MGPPPQQSPDIHYPAPPIDLPSGAGGSREKFTKTAFIIGCVAEGLAGTLLALQAGGVLEGWFPMALAALGVVLQISTYFGYVRSETLIKRDALKAGAAAASAVTTTGQAAAVMRQPG